MRFPRDFRVGDDAYGEDGGDAVTRTRRGVISDSKVSSVGNEYSLWK